MYAAPSASMSSLGVTGGLGGGSGTGLQAPAPITPLNVRLRSRSTDRFNGSGTLSDAPGTGKFVDPLVARRQAKLEAQLSAGPPPPKALVGKKKVPVGELVAFFDQEKV